MATEVSHPLFARFYAKMAVGAERAGAAEHRRELLSGLSGTVIEVGAGNGLNFGYYPPTVSQVLAVEPEPHLRQLATAAAARAAVPITVVDGTAEGLPAGDGDFDCVVASLVLCSVPDQASALAEMRRVIRPGAELRYYEHVRAGTPKAARLQDRMDPIWSFFGGGCHPNRDTEAAIALAGFDIEDRRPFLFQPCFLAKVVATHVIGRARRH